LTKKSASKNVIKDLLIVVVGVLAIWFGLQFVFGTETHPKNSLFCSQPTGKGGKCSFADFVKTYFVLKDSGDDYVTVCRTPTDVCNELLRSKAKSLEEVSKNS